MAITGPLEDRVAIRELLDVYADGVNQRDAEVWANTWAEESEWNLPVIPGMEQILGRDNIRAAWLQGMDYFPFVFMAQSLGMLQVDGDTAIGRSYAAEVAVTTEGEEIRPRGQYDDTFVKVGGEWKFKRRIFRSLHGE